MQKLLAVICAVICPPLGVLVNGKWTGVDLGINVILTFLLFWIPGLIHALYLILRD